MNNKIFNTNNLIIVLLLFSYISTSTAAETFYEIRADGLACPYCAYGIEKKFMKIKGVKHFDIDLKQGKIVVIGDAQLDLKNEQLKALFNESGFTFRKIVSKEIRE